MDTEFPGVVARPIGEFKSSSDYQYQLLRCNVDLLKIIQLGVTFMDDKGNLPDGITTWQFNFKTICQVVRHHDYIAMDTEFPGVVARPIGEFKSSSDYQYQLLRCNV